MTDPKSAESREFTRDSPRRSDDVTSGEHSGASGEVSIGGDDAWFRLRFERNRQKVYICWGRYDAQRNRYPGVHFGRLCGRWEAGWGL